MLFQKTVLMKVLNDVTGDRTSLPAYPVNADTRYM